MFLQTIGKMTSMSPFAPGVRRHRKTRSLGGVVAAALGSVFGINACIDDPVMPDQMREAVRAMSETAPTVLTGPVAASGPVTMIGVVTVTWDAIEPPTVFPPGSVINVGTDGALAINADGTLSITPPSDIVDTASVNFQYEFDGGEGLVTRTGNVTTKLGSRSLVPDTPILATVSYVPGSGADRAVFAPGATMNISPNGSVEVDQDGRPMVTPPDNFHSGGTLQYTLRDWADGTRVGDVVVRKSCVRPQPVAAPPPLPLPDSVPYPNEPESYVPFAEHSFSGGLIPANGEDVTTVDHGLIRGSWAIYAKSGLSIVPDGAGDGVLRSAFPMGMNPGSSSVGGCRQWNLQLWDESGTRFATAVQMQKLYMAAWVRIGEAAGFAMPAAQQKLFAFGAATTNGGKVDARLMILNTAGNHNLQTTFRLEVNNQAVPGSLQVDHGVGDPQSGQSQFPNTENADYAMQAGQWHLVETVMELNDIGLQNGVWHVWIDGIQVHDRTDWVHRTAERPNGFYVWKWEPTWGGGGNGPRQVEDYIDLAHVYMSGLPVP